MRKLTLLLPIILACAIFSCKEISYKETQPVGKQPLTEVPRELQGSFMVSDSKDNSSDTLFINKWGYYVASDKKKRPLGDSLQLKTFKGYYFVNVNEDPEWLLRIIKVEKNGDLQFMSMPTDEKTFAGLIKKLSRETKVDSIDLDSERLYQIDPSPKELMNLLDKGFFSQKVNMKKLN